ncbi:MAG TPA: 23S rRNA (pseudouridine(1915)-N(3))-methyltransferase RlmH [Parvularculaceae bacterium]|nr:23S rRNA (pseudouridine(1915)-N(3))-methyltransferase RlmH [Parvularculaceae bacterium]
MRLTVAAIGRLRAGPEFDLVADYSARLQAIGKPLGLFPFEIKEFEAPKGLAGDKRRKRQSEMLDEAAPPGAKRVVLDERGVIITSESLARTIERWRDDGVCETAFMIGGADGHDPSLAASADLSIAFGKATFPHLLVRAMLVEQIYRAATILSGHPYHRG